MNIQNYSPAANQHSGARMTESMHNHSPRMDQQITGQANAGVAGGLNFDTNLGATQSTTQNMQAIMGSTAAQGINFLDNDPINQNVSQNNNQAMNNNMGTQANSQGDQMLHLMSMLQNVMSMLMNMVTNNNNNSQNAQNNQNNSSPSEASANDTGIDYGGESDSGDYGDYGEPAAAPSAAAPSAAAPSTAAPSAATPSTAAPSESTSEPAAEPTTHAGQLIANARAAAAEKNQAAASSGTTSESTTTDATSSGTSATATDSAAGTSSAAKSSNITATPSSQADFEQHFETEGNSPYQADGTQVFDAFASDVRTENGNGIRGENKIKEEDRVSMAESNESFSATITPDLSPGSQAIVSQWHGQDEGALVKLYVDDQDGDVQTAGAENGVAGDGVFDVYTVYKDAEGEQHRINHGTITEGESLDVNFEKTGNDFSANVNGVAADFSVTDDPEVYFKYGMYLQTKDPMTGEKAQPNDGGMDILARNNITNASAIFENASFTREIV